jgi:glucokinase
MSTIGVDIGGTKIAVGLLDDNAQLRASATAPTPTTGAQAVLAQVTELLARLGGPVVTNSPATRSPAADSPTAIGVGAPGVIDSDGVVQSATSILPHWAGTRVRAELAHRTGLPVIVDNDVRVLAFAEARLGAGRPFGTVLHVSVGTGVGGALTESGRLVHGKRDSAGEIAHLLVPERGPIPCGCGRFDHLEAIAAGPAIAAAAGESTVPAVVDRMRAGDAAARAAITGAATMLGRTLAGFATALDLDAVIVGGGVSRIGADFLDPLARALRAEIRPAGRDIPILPAALGPDAAVIGAALLAREYA